MANFGTGYVNVVPKFTGFKSAVEAELNKVNPNQKGQEFGTKFSTGASGGLVKSGAIVGAFATITNKAMSSVAGHLDSAISRFDTLNNYPKVMQSLGYSAEDAEASINKMSDRLQNLPTTLDSMVSLTQGLVTVTGDLGKATDAGLALNDMLVASGSNQQLVTAAMEQFRQMLSKGKPEMEDWRSLTSAMPGQMDQLAKSMLGPTANANDLYAALGGGHNEATISMDELLNAMIRLDTEGGANFASFQEQAETAAGGVRTAVANMGNAITKGITGVFDAIGKDNISGVFNDIKGGINDAFGVIQSVVGGAVPTLKSVYEAIKPWVPQILAAGAAFTVLTKAQAPVMSLVGTVKNLGTALALTKGGAGTFAESLAAVGMKANPVGIALGVASVAITGIASAMIDAKQKSDNFKAATEGLDSAISSVTGLGDYAVSLSDIAGQADNTVMSIDDLNELWAEHARNIQSIADEANEQIGVLNTAQSIINQYAGQTDLSTDAQGRLNWALQQVNEQFGLNLTASDVATNSYKDQNGEIQNLTDNINKLIESKKNEIKMNALSDAYAEQLKVQEEANKAYVDALNSRGDKEKEIATDLMMQGIPAEQADALAKQEVNRQLDELKGRSNEAADGLKDIENQMGDLSKSTSESATELDKWGQAADQLTSGRFSALLADKGGISALKEDLDSLGASTVDLNELSGDKLEQLAQSYDGTATSIVGKLAEFGVGMDEAKQKAAEAADGINSALDEMGASESLKNVGIDVSNFSQKLAEAGVSTETLNSIGSENLAALAQACNGNIGQMVGMIQLYNAEPIIDKDGNVQIDKASLVDAQGNVYTWNGSELVDKNGNAAVNDTELTDAQGHKVIWNGTDILYKSNDGVVHNLMNEGIIARDKWNNEGLNNYEGTGTINIFGKITETVTRIFGGGNAKGGIRMHADGGIIQPFTPRFHGTGAVIAKQAIPLDIVGEDGAEAIVPLTNKRYSQPFIDLLADGINQQDDTASTAAAMVIAWLDTNLGSIINRNTPQDFALDGRTFASAVRRYS